MLRVLNCDRAAKTIEFGEPCMVACGYDGRRYAVLYSVTNLHALTLGLAGWRVNGVRIGDAGITREWLEEARANTSQRLAGELTANI
jgi:hypothetical protein